VELALNSEAIATRGPRFETGSVSFSQQNEKKRKRKKDAY